MKMTKSERTLAALALVEHVARLAHLTSKEQAKRAVKVTQWAQNAPESLGKKLSDTIEPTVLLAEALMNGEDVEMEVTDGQVDSDKQSA